MTNRTFRPAARRNGNRGSGIITVLVTMLFIITLGATLLFTSYTGYLVKVSERGGKRSFYSASTAMDEIKAGVQQAVTESLSSAYTDVLSEYTALSASGNTALQLKFAEIFKNDFLAWHTPGGDYLFESAAAYFADTMETFVSPPSGTVDVSGSRTVSEGTIEDKTYLRLEAISVTYTSADGYQSSVTSDIIVTMPDFTATTATVVSSELPSFALIAGGTLSSAANNPLLAGNAYAGEVSLTANGNKLTYGEGTLVCAGSASVSSGATLQTGAAAEVWAGNVVVNADGTARLYGRTFVADDLTLDGNRAKAELKGSYYGFGSGTSAGISSAIVVNGKGTTLDIDGLDRLILAGVSFVDTTGDDIRTGESISAKSNQLAYLAEKSCVNVYSFYDTNGNGAYDEGEAYGTVTGTNPCVFTGDILAYSIDTAAPLWGGTRTLGYYGVSYSAAGRTYLGITPVVKNLSGTGYRMAYFFITFSSQAGANQYFREYFSANPEKIREYIDIYVDLSNTADITLTAGNTLYADADGDLFLKPGTAGINVEGRSAQFTNRCQTLNPSKGSAGDTPYTYFINVAAITESLEFTLPSDPGTPAARIVSGDFTVSAGEPAKVIIATGNVAVAGDYEGLIIAGGNVALNADVAYSPAVVKDILYGAVDGEGNLLSAWLKNVAAGGHSGSGITSSWDLDLLVAYDNWLKN